MKKRILIISDAWHPQINGVVRTYEHIVEELRNKGHSVEVIGPGAFRYSFPLPMYKEIRVCVFPYRALKRKIESFDPTDIHIATEGALGMAAKRYCVRSNKRFTTTYHTHFPDYIALRVPKMLRRVVTALTVRYIKSFHNAASAMAVATASLKDTIEAWGITTPKMTMIRGVDTNMFHPGASQALQNTPAPRALYVGRVAVEKNIEDFLDMPFEGTKIIVGDGPALQRLKHAYPDAVFTGKQTGKDLADIYRACDVFVFPSRTDTFGIVIIEALASGLPVAGYTVTGPKDILTDPVLGAVHESDLSVAVQNAMAYNNEKHQQSRVDHIKTHYTWGKVAEQFLMMLDFDHKSQHD